MCTRLTKEGKELMRKAYEADLSLPVSGLVGCGLMPQTLERCRGVEEVTDDITSRAEL